MQEGGARSNCCVLVKLQSVPFAKPRRMAAAGVQQGLPLQQRTSEPLDDVVICGPLHGGRASTVRVRCRHRHSNTPWSGALVGHRRAPHTTTPLSPPSRRLFKKGGIASAGNRNRVTSIATTNTINHPLMPLRPLCKQFLSFPQGLGSAPARRGRLHAFCVTSVGASKRTRRSP